jgi:HAD superfamily hydrolase (TIGR01509 family)
MINTLLFDFDGLILDTETPDYTAWQEIYAGYGCTLSIHEWGTIIGGSGFADFDAVATLEKQTGRKLDHAALNTRWRKRGDELIADQDVLPGVREYLEAARRLGLHLAIASSSDHAWVDGHLKRLGLWEYFEAVICSDDVLRTKPDPELFVRALAALNTRAEESLVFEDSPNGVKAAKAAGIRVIAVPNGLTEQLSITGADLVLPSLAALPLEDLLLRFNLTIRQELPTDIPAIHAVNRAAFPREEEANLVDLVRERGNLVLSLVATDGEHILGHVMYSPVTLEPDQSGLRGLGLGPVAVMPEVQGKGVGSQLIENGMTIGQRRGYDFVVLLGDPRYYSRFGFIPGREFGLNSEYGDGDEFQARELRPGVLRGVKALVKYCAEFAETVDR